MPGLAEQIDPQPDRNSLAYWLSAPFKGYFKRQGELAQQGLATANAGAQQVGQGDLSGLAGLLTGPLGYVASPINALVPSTDEVYGAARNTKLSPEMASLLAGGVGLMAMGLPGPKTKGLGRGLSGLAGDVTAGEQASLASRLNAEAPQGITAYHGSPHTFDKFSMDKIGTGEGAQAYGHGLYFAENENVAKGYADALQKIKIGGKELAEDPAAMLGTQTGITGRAAIMVREMGYDKALEAAKAELARDQTVWADDLVNAVKDVGDKPVEVQRHMYQVRLNVKPDELLDWDRPLSEHPQKVQDALRKTGHIDFDPKDFPAVTAGGAISEASQESAKRAAKFSQQMNRAGIKGIRYKDAGSRSGEGGTYNYVIFDDKLVDILKRYGIPFTVGAGGAAMVAGQGLPPEVASQLSPQT